MRQFSADKVHLFNANAIELYKDWESPTVIISDGPYGVSGFPGDLHSHHGLDAWYEPHIKAWSYTSYNFMVLEHRGWLGYGTSDT